MVKTRTLAKTKDTTRKEKAKATSTRIMERVKPKRNGMEEKERGRAAARNQRRQSRAKRKAKKVQAVKASLHAPSRSRPTESFLNSRYLTF